MDVFVEGFDINTMIDDVISTAQPLIEKNHNTMVAEITPNLGTMHSDQMKVRQVLLNLISNAAKFTNDGTITVTCAFEIRNNRTYVVFEVADSGIGMTKEQLESLYDAFTQADSSTTRKYGGTGLGMAISKHFIDILEGEIDVNSIYGEGTSFTLRLPLMHENRQQAKGEHIPSPVQESVARRQTDRVNSVKVLVVDDDAETRELIARHLTREGLFVIEASNGEQGLEMAHEYRPDVITLDVMMPVMDGWGVLSRLKEDRDLASIPVIMLSMVDNQNLGYALGACDYLVKPVIRQQLIEVVNRTLQNARDGTVLVVEDDPDMRVLIQTLLRDAGINVAVAENGKLALEMLPQHHPAMILLDLVMPVMDGFEFLRHLRTMSKYQRTPVVVLTASDLSAETRGQLQGVVADVISKQSVSPQQLVSDIKAMVGLLE